MWSCYCDLVSARCDGLTRRPSVFVELIVDHMTPSCLKTLGRHSYSSKQINRSHQSKDIFQNFLAIKKVYLISVIAPFDFVVPAEMSLEDFNCQGMISSAKSVRVTVYFDLLFSGIMLDSTASDAF